jgi:TolB-like protein/Tfp pilus assembly protein PilF/tRNA A-37 threonylcarbamoyl transferase component Bud32
MEKTEDNNENSMIGQRIGVYELRREIGRGGMGAVYLAERADGEFYQTVAVKLIKRGMDTDLILKRFRRERQILAALNHPNIAYFLGGGSTANGLPYFVMEYIEGKPLYEFCDENKLDIKARLRIFRQICDAVDAAHQIKVIHRDLKPSNILVKAEGKPKLLDFGIAKVLDPELEATEIEPTATHLRALTPEYASPEQIRNDEITPAADVYSLGVVLYELLTGHRPYHLKNRASYEVARIICEEKPPTPSESVSREENLVTMANVRNASLTTVYAARSASLENLRRELAGDLDKIILKSLRKNPVERYQTAAGLAEDITNYLENLPVKAEKFPSLAEFPISAKSEKSSIAVLPFKLFDATRTGETGDDEFLSIGLADALVTRLSGVQRIVVRPTSSVLRFGEKDSLDAGRELDVDYVLSSTIRRAGERIRVTVQLLNVADNSTRWAENFNEKFTDVLELEDSISERVVKSLLPRLTGDEAKQLQKRGTNSPEAYEAYLRGRFYWNQFTPDSLMKARKSFEKAVELDSDYALAHVGLADFYVWANIYGLIPSSEALPLAERAALRAIELDENLGEAYATLSLTYQNRFSWAKAEKLYQKALELAPNYVHAHEWWAAQLVGHGRFEEGEREIRIAERLDPLSLRTKTLVAWTLYQSRRFEAALEIGRQIIELDKNYPQGHAQIGNNLLQLGRIEEAVENFRKFDQMIPNSALAKYALCHGLAASGKIEEARRVLEDIKTLAADGYVKPYFLGMAHAAVGEPDVAFENFEKSFGENDPWMLWLGTEPMLDALRNDARFNDLLRRMNLPVPENRKNKSESWRETTGEKSNAEKTSETKSIAVLPLKFIGAAENDDRYLSVGLADAMITKLSNVRRLVVRPTSSILPFADYEDAVATGSKLRVDFVLCGTIRHTGERVRISAQLLEVASETTIWADKFNVSFTDVLELEDIVAEKTAKLLIPKLTGDERKKLAKRGTDNPQAFEAYLRGRYHLNLFTPDEFVKAKNYFEQAIALDAEYALAYVGLADYYFGVGTFGTAPPLECYAKAGEMAERALEIDDALGEAYAILGFVYFADLDFEKVEATLRRAVQLSPNYSLGRIWLSVLLNFYGESDEAVAEAKRAAELNPLSPFDRQHYAWILYHARRFDEAEIRARRVVEGDPRFSHGLGVLAWILRQNGKTDESIETARRAVEFSNRNPWLISNLAASYARAGMTEDAFQLLSELENTATEKFVSPYCLAAAYLNLGDADRAFALLEEALETRDVWLIWLASDAQFDSLRDDPRFDDLLRRLRNYQAGTTETEVTPSPTGGEKSIVVLPFKIFGASNTGETGDEYLSVGLADALITRLSNVRRFVVRPTSAVLRFRGAADSFAAGRALDAGFVLESSIWRVGERFRVKVQLLSVTENRTLWAQTFDEDFVDFLSLEDSISEKVVASLVSQLSGEERENLARRPTDNAQAYETYLHGRFHWHKFTPEGFQKAIEYYNRAVALAPDYALAYAGIADYYNFLGVYTVMPFAVASEKAKEAALKAIALDDQLAEGYAALGFAVIMHDFDWDRAGEYLRRAVELNPNYTTARVWYCYYLSFCGRFDEAFEQINRALEIDRLTPLVPQTYFWTLYHAGRYEEAIDATRKFIKGEPQYGLSYVFLSSMLWRVGQYDEALKICRRAVEIMGRTPYMLPWLASAHAAAGNRREAAALLEEIEETAKTRYVSPYLIGMIYVNLGDAENAFAQLEKAAEIRDGRIVWLGVDPQFETLRSNPRFKEILRRTGNPLSK